VGFTVVVLLQVFMYLKLQLSYVKFYILFNVIWILIQYNYYTVKQIEQAVFPMVYNKNKLLLLIVLIILKFLI
jgi:hypothetical protein